MSNQSVTVLCPNARRVTVKTTPNTSLLQILEQACAKQNYNADLYTLKHLKRSLDVSSLLRFAGLPNRCVLEMQELSVPRQQQLVMVCLTDAGGARHVSEHLPSASLWAVVEASGLASAGDSNTAVPSVLYGLHRICGKKNLEETSLKSLGLSGGRVSMRFIVEDNESQKKESLPEVLPREKPGQNSTVPQVLDGEKSKVTSDEDSMMEIQPEIIPVAQSQSNVLPEATDIVQSKELKHATDSCTAPPDVAVASSSASQASPDVAVAASSANQASPDVAVAASSANQASPDVAVAASSANQASPDVAVAASSANQASPDVAVAASSANQPSPDVVSSIEITPDVIKRSDDSTPRPDVVAAEPVTPKSSVTAFSGTGWSLGRPTASAVDHPPQQEVQHPQQEEHQLMEVDSTQDSALMTLSSRNAVVFDESTEVFSPQFVEDDDFFEVTAEDIRKLHRDQLHQIKELSETPLLTQEMREADAQARLLASLRSFPVTTLRIQFPEGVGVQARFRPTDTVQDVAVFVAALLRDEALEFDLLNMFPRAPLSRLHTLHAAGLVPRARVLFSPHGGTGLSSQNSFLKPSVVAQAVSRQHAQAALTPTRKSDAPSKKGSAGPSTAHQSHASSSSNVSGNSNVGPSKKPKWFKLTK